MMRSTMQTGYEIKRMINIKAQLAQGNPGEKKGKGCMEYKLWNVLEVNLHEAEDVTVNLHEAEDVTQT